MLDLAEYNLTINQYKFINILYQILQGKTENMSLAKIAKKAGYSDALADQPCIIIRSKGIQKVLNDKQFLRKIKSIRDRAGNFITDAKLQKASANDLTKIIDTMQRNANLLQGKATTIAKNSNLNVNVNDLTAEEIKEILKSKLNNTEAENG